MRYKKHTISENDDLTDDERLEDLGFVDREDLSIICNDDLVLTNGNVIGRPDWIIQNSLGDQVIMDYKNRAYKNHGSNDKDRYQVIVYFVLYHEYLMKELDEDGGEKYEHNVAISLKYMDKTLVVVPTITETKNVIDWIQKLNYEYKYSADYFKKMTGKNLSTATGIGEILTSNATKKALLDIYKHRESESRLSKINEDSLPKSLLKELASLKKKYSKVSKNQEIGTKKHDEMSRK